MTEIGHPVGHVYLFFCEVHIHNLCHILTGLSFSSQFVEIFVWFCFIFCLTNYIVDINLLSNICITNILPQFVACFFIFFMVDSGGQEPSVSHSLSRPGTQ